MLQVLEKLEWVHGSHLSSSGLSPGDTGTMRKFHRQTSLQRLDQPSWGLEPYLVRGNMRHDRSVV